MPSMEVCILLCFSTFTIYSGFFLHLLHWDHLKWTASQYLMLQTNFRIRVLSGGLQKFTIMWKAKSSGSDWLSKKQREWISMKPLGIKHVYFSLSGRGEALMWHILMLISTLFRWLQAFQKCSVSCDEIANQIAWDMNKASKGKCEYCSWQPVINASMKCVHKIRSVCRIHPLCLYEKSLWVQVVFYLKSVK